MTAKTVTQVHQERKQPVSFEIFPPKGDLAQEDAVKLASQLAPLDPAYISVTYSAGGSGNKRATSDVASLIQRDYGVTAVAHLTCQGLKRDHVEGAGQVLKDAGVVNVLALRGDPVPDGEPGDFDHATDLIPLMAEQGFCVGAAAYPEGHVSCLDLDEDIKHVREKQDAGAEFLVTQLFFDNEVAYRFQDKAEKAGVTIPISYGVMPFLSKSQVSRMIFMCGASLPSKVIKLLARYEDDPESLRKAGIEYACDQLVDLKAHGVDGLHVYIMNRPSVARAAMEALAQV